jgi:hypothetical protein
MTAAEDGEDVDVLGPFRQFLSLRRDVLDLALTGFAVVSTLGFDVWWPAQT